MMHSDESEFDDIDPRYREKMIKLADRISDVIDELHEGEYPGYAANTLAWKLCCAICERSPSIEERQRYLDYLHDLMCRDLRKVLVPAPPEALQ